MSNVVHSIGYRLGNDVLELSWQRSVPCEVVAAVEVCAGLLAGTEIQRVSVDGALPEPEPGSELATVEICTAELQAYPLC